VRGRPPGKTGSSRKNPPKNEKRKHRNPSNDNDVGEGKSHEGTEKIGWGCGSKIILKRKERHLSKF